MRMFRNLSNKSLRGLLIGILAMAIMLNLSLLPAMASLQVEEGAPPQNSSQDVEDLDEWEEEESESAMGMLPGDHTDLPMIVDEGELLTDREERELDASIQSICKKWNIDLVVVTVDDFQGKSSMVYADDFYDMNGYAQNGCLLLVSMEEREYWISTSGSMINVLTDMGIDFIGHAVAEKLAAGEYQNAFLKYASMVDSFSDEYKEGAAYDIDNLPNDEDYGFVYDGDYNDLYEAQKRGGFHPMYVLIGFLFGAFVSLIIMSGYEAELLNVQSQHGADDYLKKNSVSIYEKSDRFLYSQVTHTPKPKPQDRDGGGHSGGSSIHMSSGGSSHGGGGGKF